MCKTLSSLIRACCYLLFASLSLVGRAQSVNRKPVIIGYVTDKGWTTDQIDASKLTHINYAFAVPAADGKLAPLTSLDSLNLSRLTSLRNSNKELKILISIGGWGGCKYFSDAALTDQSRQKFANDAVALLKKHKLDGLDIDWEYPAQVGAGNIYRPEDKQTFTLFLKALRDRLDEQGKEDKRPEANHYLLTAATGGDTAFVTHTELGQAQKYLDYVNIMTYDLYHGNDKVSGHHSPLAQSKKGDQSRNSSISAVEGHIRAGVPARKIVLGLPFYGRGWNKVADKDNGLYQPSTGEHQFISYDELADKYINKNGFTRYWDADAKAPYLWNPTTHTFISYADEESFTPKLDYVKAKGLAGVMFWEYTYDLRQKKLLDKLVQGLR
ncbi:glycoside hydrolase family 18 protein [Spirosoma utsteinense]|uniref:chitinase n=1 Tax=Spirosoma utsteinense TaxID=2585773 RepID=A0ABR6WEC5_9BACT|nr:glycoside hydrolase family 18 protein [Spirosoma utsteinense]MBC3787511.1 chitinase [Spirosoma utsteinense]MBC3794898.1 chitinase [Spirosoma utsteinense]